MEVKFCFKWNSHLRWLLAGIIAASNFYTETGTVDTKLWEKSILNTLRDLKTAEKKKTKNMRGKIKNENENRSWL